MNETLEYLRVGVHTNCRAEPRRYALRLIDLQTASRLYEILRKHATEWTGQVQPLRAIMDSLLNSWRGVENLFYHWRQDDSGLVSVTRLLLSASKPNREREWAHLMAEILCVADMAFQERAHALITSHWMLMMDPNQIDMDAVATAFADTRLWRDLAAELRRRDALREQMTLFLRASTI